MRCWGCHQRHFDLNYRWQLEETSRRRIRENNDEGNEKNHRAKKKRSFSAFSEPNNISSSASSIQRKQSNAHRRSTLLPKKVRTNTEKETKQTVEENKGDNNKRRRRRRRRSDTNETANKPKRNTPVRHTDETYSSLLPPPLKDFTAGKESGLLDEDDPLQSGLSSWEEFLGGGDGPQEVETTEPEISRIAGEYVPSNLQLPAIEDLFPSNLGDKNPSRDNNGKSLDGVLPVSDLFYRSPKHMKAGRNSTVEEAFPDGSSGDEQRTPKLSRKQSKKRTGRKMVRRGMEMLVGGVPINADPPKRAIEIMYKNLCNTSVASAKNWAQSISINSGEFGPLLHGPSIPQVSFKSKGLFCEHFCHATMKWDVCPKDLRTIVKSYMLDTAKMQRHDDGKTSKQSQDVVVVEDSSKNRVEEIVFLENGKTSTVTGSSTESEKENLKRLASNLATDRIKSKPRQDRSKEAHRRKSSARGFGKTMHARQAEDDTQTVQLGNGQIDGSLMTMKLCFEKIEVKMSKQDFQNITEDGQILKSIVEEAYMTNSILRKAGEFNAEYSCRVTQSKSRLESCDLEGSVDLGPSNPVKEKHFRKWVKRFIPLVTSEDIADEILQDIMAALEEEPTLKQEAREKLIDALSDGDDYLIVDGAVEFELGVSRGDLEAGDADCTVFRDVLARSITDAMKDDIGGFKLEIANFTINDHDDGTSLVSADVEMESTSFIEKSKMAQRERELKNALKTSFRRGGILTSLAREAANESRWPQHVRDLIIEECRFEKEDVRDLSSGLGPASYEDASYIDVVKSQSDTIKSPSKSNGLYLGNGDNGAFWDYSETSLGRAPYQGNLGPRLVDAVVERARQRQPRVLAIGDVHGCIDELQDLLRQCDYRPGDLVVFLGDLVCKGPDSISVVQMAREIGALGVRGNHDFEVVRWHHAIQSGVDPPVVGSEHFHIASCLSQADMKWMSNLPWYMSSKDLGALFVHAGFVSGIRLAKQNPRLMMNMRSILPDGTVTSKFFNNWPWARLWDGTQTVLFGHDADRGLQQYENAIGLDTGCVYGGRLTACILPEKRLVSVSARREYFKYRRKHYD